MLVHGQIFCSGVSGHPQLRVGYPHISARPCLSALRQEGLKMLASRNEPGSWRALTLARLPPRAQAWQVALFPDPLHPSP